MTRDEEILTLLQRPGWWETKVLPRMGAVDSDGCRHWTGYVSPDNGYAYMKLTGIHTPAGSTVQGRVHRVVYLHEHGVIPSETLDHLCRHRSCVEVSHLEAVTSRENLLRGETIVAANAVKTHCPKGHALSEDNLLTYSLKLGMRACAECSRERSRRWKAAQKMEQR